MALVALTLWGDQLLLTDVKGVTNCALLLLTDTHIVVLGNAADTSDRCIKSQNHRELER